MRDKLPFKTKLFFEKIEIRKEANLLTFMSFHKHSVVLKAVDSSDEGDGSADEVHDLGNADEWVRLAMHGLDFLCHL